ncbi:MAG: hypothetical protein JST95_02030 [Bacteroidetes bacterium]|nr:hypothetical protein [Bacteroidota bacterium]
MAGILNFKNCTNNCLPYTKFKEKEIEIMGEKRVICCWLGNNLLSIQVHGE